MLLNSLQIYRQGAPTVIIPIDEDTVYMDECMGRFDITAQFYAPDVLDIRVDDYIIYNGVRYTINVPYQITRSAVIQYNIVFEHPSYWLKDFTFKHLSSIEFSYYGTPAMFIDLIVDIMNIEDSGWMVGVCEDVAEKLIDFYADGQGYSCKGALQLIAETFELEYWFSGDGKIINITKQAGNVTNIHFSYGRTKGLYSVERAVLDTPLYNRIYGFGGTTNIPYDYRSGAKRLTFDGSVIERPLGEGERRREMSVVFDDIYPERTGTISAVSADLLGLTDISLDFDLNGNKIDGETPTLVFKTGELGGKSFEISSYSNTTKTIRIKQNTDSDGYVTPNETFSPDVGDQYTLVGIEQPQSYIADAEQRLYDKVNDTFKQITRPPYRVEIDEKYMRENGFSLKSGDRVRLVDDKLSVDDLIRVTSVSFPIVNPYQCTVVISDTITYTTEVQTVIKTDKIKESVKIVDRTKAELARRNALRMRQLQELVFDPDGYFDGTHIKPNSIETLMLSVGAKSQNFYLNGVRIEANSGDDANTLKISAGELIHKEIQIEGLGYVWEIGGSTFDSLDPEKSYYLSAKCSRTALVGQWYLSETPMTAESEAGYYHFNIGVLYAVLDGRRDYSFTYGMTYINGDQITTGKIDADRLNVEEIFAQLIAVGSEGYENAGISGLADQGNLSQRFWAGATASNRYNAPFQVLNDGSLKAFKGEIGGFEITDSSLKIGEENTWTPNAQSVFLYGAYFLLRDNGAVSGQRRELSWNLYKDNLGAPRAAAASIFNTIDKSATPGYYNIGLELESSGATNNYALWVTKGLSLFKGLCYEVQTLGNNVTISEDCAVAIFDPQGSAPYNINLPTYPKKGWIVSIRNTGFTQLNVLSNNGSIFSNTSASASTSVALGSYATGNFIHNGNYWYQL